MIRPGAVGPSPPGPRAPTGPPRCGRDRCHGEVVEAGGGGGVAAAVEPGRPARGAHPSWRNIQRGGLGLAVGPDLAQEDAPLLAEREVVPGADLPGEVVAVAPGDVVVEELHGVGVAVEEEVVAAAGGVVAEADAGAGVVAAGPGVDADAGGDLDVGGEGDAGDGDLLGVGRASGRSGGGAPRPRPRSPPTVPGRGGGVASSKRSTKRMPSPGVGASGVAGVATTAVVAVGGGAGGVGGADAVAVGGGGRQPGVAARRSPRRGRCRPGAQAPPGPSAALQEVGVGAVGGGPGEGDPPAGESARAARLRGRRRDRPDAGRVLVGTDVIGSRARLADRCHPTTSIKVRPASMTRAARHDVAGGIDPRVSQRAVGIEPDGHPPAVEVRRRIRGPRAGTRTRRRRPRCSSGCGPWSSCRNIHPA